MWRLYLKEFRLFLCLADTLVRSEQFEVTDTMEDEIKEIVRKGILYSDLLIECSSLLEEYSREVLLDEKNL